MKKGQFINEASTSATRSAGQGCPAYELGELFEKEEEIREILSVQGTREYVMAGAQSL
jgi:hypothetical protein